MISLIKHCYWPTAELFVLIRPLKVLPWWILLFSYNYCADEHGGTHLDAPVHFAKGKWATDEIPLENLVGEAVVIDVSDKALKNADYLITTEDIQAGKNKGEIADNVILFFRTGYGLFILMQKNI
jgi:hypothetical protein